jgi:hypothetical protein
MLNLERLTHKGELTRRNDQLKLDAQELRDQIIFLQAYARRLEEMIHSGKEPL